MKITGSLQSIEARISPLASAALDGVTTLIPATCANHASSMSECCPPKPTPTPVVVRITIGTLVCPPDMKRSLAAWLTIWSMHTPTKFISMISAIGR